MESESTPIAPAPAQPPEPKPAPAEPEGERLSASERLAVREVARAHARIDEALGLNLNDEDDEEPVLSAPFRWTIL